MSGEIGGKPRKYEVMSANNGNKRQFQGEFCQQFPKIKSLQWRESWSLEFGFYLVGKQVMNNFKHY